MPEEIAKRFRALLDYKITATRIRSHGDYHLGQVRYTGKDFIIASFEGDATRPISERRIKRSPLTDVACMLLSFQRAALVSLENEGVRSEDIPFLKPWTRFWFNWIRETFLKAYVEETRPAGFFPNTPAEFGILLDLYLVDKAVSDLIYAFNRAPGLIEISWRTLSRVLDESG